MKSVPTLCTKNLGRSCRTLGEKGVKSMKCPALGKACMGVEAGRSHCHASPWETLASNNLSYHLSKAGGFWAMTSPHPRGPDRYQEIPPVG